MYYKILNNGKLVKTFKTKKEAESFRAYYNRYDWNIILTKPFKQSTKKQKDNVYFCEKWLCITFKGDINNYYEVLNFLEVYLDDAKDAYSDTIHEWESYIWD